MATIAFVTIIRDQCNKLRRVYRNDVMMSRWHHCPGDLLPLHRTESANAPDRILSRQSFANWSTVVFYFTPSKRGSQYLIDARFRTSCAQYRLICNCITSILQCNYACRADVSLLRGSCKFFSLQDWDVWALFMLHSLRDDLPSRLFRIRFDNISFLNFLIIGYTIHVTRYNCVIATVFVRIWYV